MSQISPTLRDSRTHSAAEGRTGLAMDDNNYLLKLQAAKEGFRQCTQHLSEDQRELEWLRICGAGYALEKPRTSSWNFQSSDDPQTMMFTRSEGSCIQRSRAPFPRSPSGGPYATLSNHNRRNHSVSAWQIDADGNYISSPASRAGRKRSRETMPTPMPRLVEAKAYEPGEYVSTFTDPAPILTAHHELLANDTPANYCHDQTHLPVNTDANSDWSLSYDGPSTPSTPATALTDTSTLSSQMMSRNGSIDSYNSVNNLLTQDFNMLRVKSNISLLGEDSNTTLISTDLNQEEFIPDFVVCYQSDPHYFVTHDQDASTTSSFTFSSDSSNEFLSHLSTSSHSTQNMKRLSSTQSSESDSSTSQSRSSRRHQEQILQANSCRIAPKVNASEKLSPTAPLFHVTSEDGSVQMKAAISRKAPYQRPQHPKLFCELCKDHLEGFRGEHELQRHMKRAHPEGVRKVWVCVDIHGDGKFLQNCKACRMKKRYGAYYNAAAHLRRAHFNPRKRGRKAKNEAEKRGGKGGGNWPAMDYLKERWMREIEEVVDENSPPVDSDYNAAADAEDEQQGEQEPLISTTEQSQLTPVSLSPDAHCNNNTWPESSLQFTTDYLTNATYDLVTTISPTLCYSFDSQPLTSHEMESCVKTEDLQTPKQPFYPDHCFSEDWSE